MTEFVIEDFEEFLSPDDLVDSVVDDPTFMDQSAREPDSDFVEEKKETPQARKYRLKVRHGINFLVTAFVQSPGTIPDAAALIYHGPQVSSAIGELADHDKRVAKAIDFITEDTIDNPYALAVVAMIPLLVQVIRNHETVVEQLPGKFKVRIPFTKRYFRLPVRFKFSVKWTKNISYEPSYLTTHVIGNVRVQEHLAKRGVKIAWPNVNAGMNGHSRG